MNLLIKPAEMEMASHLSELALKSKAHWPYDNQFIKDCKEDLTVSQEFIKANFVFIALNGEKLIGFYSFSLATGGPEMIHLFVNPKYIGIGIGKTLWKHSLEFALSQGWHSFELCADPYAAENFYLPMGCIKVGEFNSPIRPGRKLPHLKYILE